MIRDIRLKLWIMLFLFTKNIKINDDYKLVLEAFSYIDNNFRKLDFELLSNFYFNNFIVKDKNDSNLFDSLNLVYFEGILYSLFFTKIYIKINNLFFIIHEKNNWISYTINQIKLYKKKYYEIKYKINLYWEDLDDINFKENYDIHTQLFKYRYLIINFYQIIHKYKVLNYRYEDPNFILNDEFKIKKINHNFSIDKTNIIFSILTYGFLLSDNNGKLENFFIILKEYSIISAYFLKLFNDLNINIDKNDLNISKLIKKLIIDDNKFKTYYEIVDNNLILDGVINEIIKRKYLVTNFFKEISIEYKTIILKLTEINEKYILNLKMHELKYIVLKLNIIPILNKKEFFIPINTKSFVYKVNMIFFNIKKNFTYNRININKYYKSLDIDDLVIIDNLKYWISYDKFLINNNLHKRLDSGYFKISEKISNNTIKEYIIYNILFFSFLFCNKNGIVYNFKLKMHSYSIHSIIIYKLFHIYLKDNLKMNLSKWSIDIYSFINLSIYGDSKIINILDINKNNDINFNRLLKNITKYYLNFQDINQDKKNLSKFIIGDNSENNNNIFKITRNNYNNIKKFNKYYPMNLNQYNKKLNIIFSKLNDGFGFIPFYKINIFSINKIIFDKYNLFIENQFLNSNIEEYLFTIYN